MYIKVTLFPGRKKEEIKKISDNKFEIITKAKAERNMANDRAFEMLAEYFNISKSKIRLINGHHMQKKMFSIEDDAIV